ncbi:transmembrane protein, partial [Cystoisospora suis]
LNPAHRASRFHVGSTDLFFLLLHHQQSQRRQKAAQRQEASSPAKEREEQGRQEAFQEDQSDGKSSPDSHSSPRQALQNKHSSSGSRPSSSSSSVTRPRVSTDTYPNRPPSNGVTMRISVTSDGEDEESEEEEEEEEYEEEEEKSEEEESSFSSSSTSSSSLFFPLDQDSPMTSVRHSSSVASSSSPPSSYIKTSDLFTLAEDEEDEGDEAEEEEEEGETSQEKERRRKKRRKRRKKRRRRRKMFEPVKLPFPQQQMSVWILNESITSLVKKWYRHFYSPNAWTLVISAPGDVHTLERLVKKVYELFHKMKRNRALDEPFQCGGYKNTPYFNSPEEAELDEKENLELISKSQKGQRVSPSSSARGGGGERRRMGGGEENRQKKKRKGSEVVSEEDDGIEKERREVDSRDDEKEEGEVREREKKEGEDNKRKRGEEEDEEENEDSLRNLFQPRPIPHVACPLVGRSERMNDVSKKEKTEEKKKKEDSTVALEDLSEEKENEGAFFTHESTCKLKGDREETKIDDDRTGRKSASCELMQGGFVTLSPSSLAGVRREDELTKAEEKRRMKEEGGDEEEEEPERKKRKNKEEKEEDKKKEKEKKFVNSRDVPIARACDLKREVLLEPVSSEEHSVDFFFLFEKPHSQWSLHDAKFVVDVLGSEGEGSFLSILREQGLATSIDVEAEENHCYSLLRLTLELQPFNVNHTAITLIGSSLFSYLRFLRYTRLDEAFLDHRQRLYRIAFDAHLPPLPSRPGIPSIAGFVPSLFSSSSSSFSSSSSSSQSKSTNASPMKAGDSSPSPGLSAGGGGGGVGGLAVLGRETVSLSSTPGRMGIRMSPQEEVAFLAADLQELNHPQGIFSDQWVLDETTSSALNAYLDHISPDNLILMITSPVVLPLCTYSSSFFGLAFALNPLDPIQETTWKRIHSLSPEKSLLLSQHAGFSLPPVFYFLPSSSSSSSFSSTSSAEESRDPMSFPSSSELERIGGGGQQKVHLPRDYNEYGKRRRSEGSVQRRKKEEKEKEEEISHRTPSSFLVEKDRDKGRRKTPVSLSFSSHQPHLTSRQTSSEEREKGKEEEEDGEREEEKEEEKEEKDLFFSLREIPKYVEFSNPASRCYEHCELFHLPHRNEEDSPPRASISLLLNYSIPSPRDILRYEKDMLKKKSVKKRKKSNKKEKAGQKKGATSSSSSSSDLGKDSRNKKHTENDDNEEKKKKKNEEKDDRKEGEKEIAEEEQERKGEANVKGRGGEGEKLSTEGRERMKEPNTEKKFSSEMMAQVSIADQKGRAFSTGGVSSREEEEEEERRKQRDEEEEEEEDDEQEGEKKEKNSRGTYEVTEEEEPLLSAAEYREKICGLMNLYVSTVQEMIHEIVVYSSMTEVSFSISADPYAPRVEIHIDGLSSMLPLVLDVLIRGLVAGSPNAPENIPSSSSFSDIFVETSAPFSSPRKMRQAEPSSLERDPGDITSASSETDEILTEEEFIALFASSEDHPPLPTSFACTPEESAQRRNKKKAKELGGEDRGKVAARCNRYLDLSAFDQIKAERLGELRQRRRDPHSNIPNCLIELATDVLLRERRQRYWSRNGGSRRERLIDLVEHARLEDVENVGAMLKETVFIQALVMGDMNEKTAKRLLNRVASHLDVRRLPSAQELYDDPTISMKRMHPAPPFLEKQIWRRGSGKALPAIPRYRLRLHYDEVAEGGEFSSSYAHRLCGLGPSSLIGKSRASSMTTGGGQGQGGNSSTSSGSSGADSRKKDSSHPSHASKHRINNEKYELEEVDTHEDQGDSPSSKNRPSHRSKTSSSHHHSSSSNGGYQQISEAEKKTSYERQQQSRNGGGSGENVNLNQRQSLQSSSHRSHGGIGENSRSEASTKGRNLSGNSASTKASSSSSSPGQEKGATSSSLQTTAIRIELGELNDDELAAAVVLEVMLAYPLYRHLCALEEICHTLSFSFQHEPTGLSSFLLELHAYNLPACVVTERAEAWIFAQAGIFARLQDVADLLFFPYFEGGGTGGGGGNLSPSPPSYEPSSYSNFSSSAHFAYGSTPSELEAISSLPDGETVLLRRDFFKTSYSHPHPGTNFVILDGKHATAGGRGRREKGEEKKKKSSSRQTEGGGEEAQHKVHKNTGRGKGEGGNIAVKKGGDNGKGGARLQQEGLQKTTRNQEGPGREKSFVKKNEEGEEDEGFSCRPKKKKMSPKSLDAQEGRRGGRRKGGDEGTLWGYLASVRETLWSLVSGSGNSDEEEDDEDDEPSSVMGQGEKKRFCSRLPESQANRSRNAEDQDFRRKEDLKRPAGEREDDEDEDDDEEEVEREGEGYGERRREREDDEDEGKGEEIGGGGGGWGLVDGMSMLGAFDPRRFRAFADSGFFVLVNIERFHEAREKAVRNLLMLYPWEAEHYLHRFFHTTSSIPGDTSSSSSLSSFPSSSPSKKKRENSPSREDKAKEEMKRKDSMKTEKRSVVGDVEEDQEGEGQGDGHSGRAQGDQHKMKNDKRQEKEEETTMNKNHPRFYDRPFIPADVWVFVNEIRNRSYQFDTRERIARKIRSLTLENVKDFFLNYIVTSPWLVIELSTGFPVTRKRGAERGDAETPEVSGTSPFYYREYKTRGSESHNKESGGRGRRQPTKDTGAILLEDGLMLSSPDDTCNFTQRFYHERGSLDMTKLDTSESSHPLWRLRNSWSDIESIQEFRKAATRVYSLGSPHLYSSLLEKEQDHSSKKKNKQ